MSMSRRLRLALAGVLVLGPSVLAAQDRVPPRAAAGEPEIFTYESSSGEIDYHQEFELSDAVYSALPPTMTIAQAWRLMRKRDAELSAQTLPMRCGIAPDGSIVMRQCIMRAAGTDEQKTASYFLLYSPGVENPPKFRALSHADADLVRVVHLNIAMPQIPLPPVDLASGPLVAQRLVDFRFDPDRISEAYPSRALRQEIEGRQTGECQVQQDLSVICVPTGFELPEHEEIFARAFDAAFRSTSAGPNLTDGRDARGVRFPLTVVWKLPY